METEIEATGRINHLVLKAWQIECRPQYRLERIQLYLLSLTGAFQQELVLRDDFCH
jgi:hypothetical protein